MSEQKVEKRSGPDRFIARPVVGPLVSALPPIPNKFVQARTAAASPAPQSRKGEG